MKKEIRVFDYAKEICSAVPKGVLVTTKADDKVDSMSIAFGMLGVEWGKPIFIAYIRGGRFTKEQLDKNPEFTVNIPVGKYNKKIIGVCGRNSGRKMDKAKELGLTLIDGDCVNVPGIKELPLTLECKVIYKQLQDKTEILPDILEHEYPAGVESSYPGCNRDFHIAYYGEIVKAYILE